ncbi:MAG: hypothetical protein AUK63_509 [bacterium P3]|nr:MAG: hypothetical protein AUK63_509 [bacterium P3]KWW41965.1 MAG: hypothetical protein F083_616 [bacterium F083]
MSKLRHRCLYTALLLSLAASPAAAQEESQQQQPDGYRMTLTMGIGPGYGVMRDQGVSPLLYQTPGVDTRWAVGIAKGPWRYEAALTLSGGILCKQTLPLRDIGISGYRVTAAIHMGVERCLAGHGRWRLWAGGAAEDWLAVAYNSRYMNACVGMGNLATVTLWGKGEYHTGPWSLWMTAGGAPIGAWYRPGFAYVDNYTNGETEIAAFGDHYEWSTTPLPHLTGGLGATLHLQNGNTLGINYTWHFFTTRHNGAWAYEAARHSLLLQFTMAL